MHAEVSRKELLAAITTTAGIADKNVMPILGFTLLSAQDGRLWVSATDIRRSFHGSMEAVVTEPGSVAVDPEALLKLLKHATKERMVLRLEKTHVKVEIGKSSYRLNGMPAGDYPKLHLPGDSSPWYAYPSLILAELIDHVAIAQDPSEKRSHLNGILIEVDNGKTLAVACDGHRFCKAESNMLFPVAPLFIPKKGIGEIQRFLDPMGQVQICRIDDWLFLKYQWTIGIRLQDHTNFPGYREFLKPGTIIATMSRDALAGALKRLMSVMDADGGIRFEFSTGALRLLSEASSVGNGEEYLACDYSDRDRLIGLQAKLLIEILENFSCDMIAFELQPEDGEPVIIRPATAGSFHMALLMCMRA